MIEIDVASQECAGVADLCTSGHIVILRNVDAIRHLRSAMIEYVKSWDSARAPDIEDFYKDGTTLSLPTVLALSHSIKKVRADRFVSFCLAPLISRLGFKEPVRLDGGIPRFVLSPELILKIRRSGLFPSEDFQRNSADGPTEIFMPAPANVHRDYNRSHYLFQCNLWFPFHEASEEEVLRIWPQHYREPIFNMDATDENFRQLGQPLSYRLNFGDAVLFHGEHLHTSPVGKKVFCRRQSYDLRIASYCLDDTRHYRDLFLDLRNFPNRETSQPILTDHIFPSVSEGSPLPALIEVEQREDLKETDFRRLLGIFDHYPFAEDRYLILATKAVRQKYGIASNALLTVAEHSQSWFWVAAAGQLLFKIGNKNGAAKTLRKAYRLSERQRSLPNFMPVKYQHPATQPLPGVVRQQCANTLHQMGESV